MDNIIDTVCNVFIAFGALSFIVGVCVIIVSLFNTVYR